MSLKEGGKEPDQSLSNMTLGGSMTLKDAQPENRDVATEQNTMLFTKKVKEVFKNKPSVYRQFVKIVSDVKQTDSDKVDLVNKVIMLFDGYPELVSEFNNFLPSNYRIEMRGDVALIRVSEDTENNKDTLICSGSTMTDTYVTTVAGRKGDTLADTTRSSDLSDVSFLNGTTDSMGNVYLGGTSRSLSGSNTRSALKGDTMQYVKRVKKAYEKKTTVYRKFMDVLKEYHKERKCELETIRTVVDLFQNRTDLVLGFNEFLPDGYKIRMFDQRGYVIEHPGMDDGDCSDLTHIMIDEKFT